MSKSHQKKIDRFQREHPEGRKAYAKAKREARRNKKSKQNQAFTNIVGYGIISILQKVH